MGFYKPNQDYFIIAVTFLRFSQTQTVANGTLKLILRFKRFSAHDVDTVHQNRNYGVNLKCK